MSIITASLNNFAMTSQLIEHDLDKIEQKFEVDLGRLSRKVVNTDQDYYPQIEQDIRNEASTMAPHYEVFYSLEKSIRRLIVNSFISSEGANWWNSKVPPIVRQSAESTRRKEVDSGITPRSDDLIDFCTFGELSEIIKTNWTIFAGTFTSVKAVEKVMSSLNTLRGPIAHCSPLAEDEILRLRLAVRDWFRLME